MEDDEIIIVNHKASNTNQKNVKSKRTKNKKAVKKAASKNKLKMDKKKVKILKKANKNNSKLRKGKVITVIILIIICMVLLLTSSIFNIKNIEVVGNTRLTPDQVISLSGIQKETNIFAISKNSVKEKLKEEAYIKSSEIHTKLPNTVQINITERAPKYMLQFADSFVYIDNQGYMLEITNTPLEIPILIGIVTDLSNINPGNRMDIEDLKKMDKAVNKIVEIAKANEIDHLITKIDITDEKNYTLLLETEGKKAYLGECTELNTRMLLLKKIIELEEGNSGEVFLNVDLNTEDVYFRESVNV